MAHTRPAHHRQEVPHTRSAERKLLAQQVRPEEHSTLGQCSMMPLGEQALQMPRAGLSIVWVQEHSRAFGEPPSLEYLREC